MATRGRPKGRSNLRDNEIHGTLTGYIGHKCRCQPCTAASNSYGRSYRQQQKTKILEHYGNKCICCGEFNHFFLSIDHIKNDGAEHRKKVSAGAFYGWIIRNDYPNMLQILCFNCNNGKRLNNGICPHEVNDG